MWTCVTVVYLIAGTVFTARLLSPHRARRPYRASRFRNSTRDSLRYGTRIRTGWRLSEMSHRSALTELSSTAVQERHFGSIYAALRLLGAHQARSELPDLDHNVCRVLSGFGTRWAAVFIRRAIQHFARNLAGSKWDRDAKPIHRTKVRRANAPNRPASSRRRPSQTVCSPGLRNRTGSGRQHLSRDSCQPARECARSFSRCSPICSCTHR